MYFSDDNERLYSGDAEGNVVVTSTRTLRPVALWKAHEDSVLGVQEWEGGILTSVSWLIFFSFGGCVLNVVVSFNDLFVLPFHPFFITVMMNLIGNL